MSQPSDDKLSCVGGAVALILGKAATFSPACTRTVAMWPHRSQIAHGIVPVLLFRRRVEMVIVSQS